MQLSTTARNAACDAVVDLLNSGSLVLLDSNDVELAVLPLAATAFGSAVAGVATANTITSDTSTVAGTVSYAELRTSEDAVIATLTVGTTAGYDVILTSLVLGDGETQSISALTYTHPE